MVFKAKSINEKTTIPVINSTKEEIDVNNISKFSSEYGLIGKNIYIPKLIHNLDGSSIAVSVDKINFCTNEEYPHLILDTNREEDREVYQFISLVNELRFRLKQRKSSTLPED